jgi:FixJ family two-component response regulator
MLDTSKPVPVNEKRVFVIDDDAAVRGSLLSLLRSVGLQATTFSSAAEFLSSHKPDVPSCLVLDVRLPGVGGIEFQAELAKANIHIPIIFITGYGDIPMTVRAMKAGAVEFLTKPFRDQDLLDAVRTGLDRDSARREREQALSGVVSAYETLSAREKEVFPLVTSGLMNKQIAAKLGVSEITVKVHRGNITRKMGARSRAALVRMADLLGIRQQES